MREGSWLGCRASNRLPRIRDVGFQEETVTCVNRFSPSPRSASSPRWRYRVARGRTPPTSLTGPKEFPCRASAGRRSNRNPLCRMRRLPTAPWNPKTNEQEGRSHARSNRRLPVPSLDLGLGGRGPIVFFVHRLCGPQADVHAGIETDAAKIRRARSGSANKPRRTQGGSETLRLVQMDGIPHAWQFGANSRQTRGTHSLAPHRWGSREQRSRRGSLAFLIENSGHKSFLNNGLRLRIMHRSERQVSELQAPGTDDTIPTTRPPWDFSDCQHTTMPFPHPSRPDAARCGFWFWRSSSQENSG